MSISCGILRVDIATLYLTKICRAGVERTTIVFRHDESRIPGYVSCKPATSCYAKRYRLFNVTAGRVANGTGGT